MSTELTHILSITALLVLAGVIGFVVGGVIEMRLYRRNKDARREAECLKTPPSEH